MQDSAVEEMEEEDWDYTDTYNILGIHFYPEGEICGFFDNSLTSVFYIALVIQLGFIPFYALLYCICFRGGNVVTKSLMFVLYVNSSTWAWGAYLVFHFLYCGIISLYMSATLLLCIIFLSIFGAASMLDWCCAREGGYFRHQKTMNECIQYMNSMKETAPIHRVEINCYHWVTHTTYSNGRSTTTRRKVTTYSEHRDFLYDRWDDSSDYPNLPEISMSYPIVAVESNVIIAPGDDYTLTQFDSFRQNFVEQNRYRDSHIDESVSAILPGHVAKVTAKSDKQNEVPCWLNSGLFYFLLLLSCSCPLRVLFRSKSKQHTFEIRKLYYIEPEGPSMGNMGGNITVNVIDNKGEVNIDMTKLELNDGPTNDFAMQPPPYGEARTYSPGYPQAPGYQPVHNPVASVPSAPPPYNPNIV